MGKALDEKHLDMRLGWLSEKRATKTNFCLNLGVVDRVTFPGFHKKSNIIGSEQFSQYLAIFAKHVRLRFFIFGSES